MTIRPSLHLTLLIVVTSAALACAENNPPVERIPLSIWADSEEQESDMTALVGGTVEVDLNAGCVWLRAEDGLRYSVIWPAGTRLTLDPFTLHFEGVEGAPIAVEGASLSGGGGVVGRGRVSVRELVSTRDLACDDQPRIIVFNRYSPIEVTSAGPPN